MIDVLVVGSGASAVHAAWPLAEAGLRVVMIDAGHDDGKYRGLLPSSDFTKLRGTDQQQHRYFLGDNFEGVPFGPVRVGAQLTPPRQFITRGTDQHAPVETREFQAMRSLALGGLAAGWGASTMPFTDDDLDGWPVTRRDLQPHYNEIAARIGICGTNDDDLAPFVGGVSGLQPPPRPDSNAEFLYKRYRSNRGRLNGRGFFMGLPRLAMLTRKLGDRGPLRYRDMEFWGDTDRAVYRPRYTVGEMTRRFSNFEYRAGLLAIQFAEYQQDGQERVRLVCEEISTGAQQSFDARRLVLAAGTLGTARIVLRSLRRQGQRVPFVSNPYTYFPCINAGRLGRPTRDRRHSLTQLTMIYDPDGTRRNVVQPQLYSYRSLLLFKLLKESPLAIRESIPMLRALQEYFVIVGVFHPDRCAEGKYLELQRNNRLRVEWAADAEEKELQRAHERRVVKCLGSLGCRALKRIDPGPGSSIHYAGSFPMRRDGSDLTTTPDGSLRAAPLVSLADGSTFPHLPAKGLTFTLMANANRIGAAIALQLASRR